MGDPGSKYNILSSTALANMTLLWSIAVNGTALDIRGIFYLCTSDFNKSHPNPENATRGNRSDGLLLTFDTSVHHSFLNINFYQLSCSSNIVEWGKSGGAARWDI
jgi:hypothetical protein